MNKAKFSKPTKVMLMVYIAFILLCGIFVGMSISALTSTKTATGTISFALTNSPEMSMNLNFVVDANNKTYLGTTTDALITSSSDVLRVNIKDVSSLKIQLTFDNNEIYVPSSLSIATNNGVALTKTSNANGVAVFESSANVNVGDYLVLDKLLSAIYPTSIISNQNYEMLVTSQASGSVPATAKLSGIYSNSYAQHNVNFTKNVDYGTINKTSISVPYGSTYSASGGTITFKDNNSVTLDAVTATPYTSTAQYTYSFSSWSSTSGTITGETNIQANFTRTTKQYTVTFYNYDGTSLGVTSTVNYGGTATYTGTTPTRASDSTYTYTFAGWTTTAGGSTADDLTNVIANRNVYATYDAMVIGYNVNINWSGNYPSFLLNFEGDTQTINDVVYPNFYFASNQTYTYCYQAEGYDSISYVNPTTGAISYIGTVTPGKNNEDGVIYSNYSQTEKICDIKKLPILIQGNTLTFYICGIASSNTLTLSNFQISSGTASNISYSKYNSSDYVYKVVVTGISSDITISFNFNNEYTCFTGDTLVWVDDGSEGGAFKRIDEIEVGEKVYSYNETTGEIGTNYVNYVFEHIDVITNMVYLDVGNTIINTTDAHLFLLSNGTWVAGKDLRVGDILKTSDGEIVIQNITYETKVITTYNLNIDNDHTYFVTNNKIIVHNIKAPMKAPAV